MKIPKGFFKKLKYDVKIPTIKCSICNQNILDTPTNRIKNQIYEYAKAPATSNKGRNLGGKRY